MLHYCTGPRTLAGDFLPECTECSKCSDCFDCSVPYPGIAPVEGAHVSVGAMTKTPALATSGTSLVLTYELDAPLDAPALFPLTLFSLILVELAALEVLVSCAPLTGTIAADLPAPTRAGGPKGFSVNMAGAIGYDGGGLLWLPPFPNTAPSGAGAVALVERAQA